MATISFIRRLWDRDENLPEPSIAPEGFKGATLPQADVIPLPVNVQRHDDATEALAQRAFIIEYRDNAGNVSERRIIAREVFTDGAHSYLKATCLERQASRTFRVDRIRAVYSGVTGEALGPPPLIFAATLQRPTPKPPTRQAGPQVAIRYAVRVLMTLARADGVVHPAELDVVREFLREALPNPAYGEAAEMCEHAVSLAPSFQTFLESVEKVCNAHAPTARLMLSAARALIAADGRVDADEEDLLADLGMVLSAHGVTG